MKKLLLVLAALALSNISIAQVGSTAKEGAKATAEKAQEVGDDAKAAVSSEPNKSIDKAKAKVHHAKAHHHAKAAKDAAKEIPK
jgi:methionine synthase I (cobalamin-dependent)